MLPLILLLSCTDKSAPPLDPAADGDSAARDSAPSDTVETASGETGAPESGLPETGSADTGPAEETAEPLVTDETVEGMGDDPAGWLFSDDEVHRIDLYFPESTATALNSSPYEYAPADIVIDDMSISNVGIRLKGKIGSYRNLSQKAAFKVDFNAYVEDQSFYGLTKLNLNNMVVDYSMLKEHVAYKAFRDNGIAAERTGYAWVTVNGEAYGLYNILEQPNKGLLERWYDDPSGNLYDGKYIWYGGYSYTLLDLRSDLAVLYALEEGEDVGNADLSAIADALATYDRSAGFYDGMADFVDWDQVLTYWAVEQWVGHNDGYVLNRNNNFIYITADEALMNFVPWDMDYSLLNDTDWGMNWASPYGMLAAACRRDTTCLAAWKEAAGRVVDNMDGALYEAYAVEQALLIQDYVSADPRKEVSTGSVGYYQSYVRTWVTGRNAYMTSFWGL